MPKNWKYIKKQLEKEYLCERLQKHITYDLTNYKPATWYQQHFIMKFDDEVLLDASQVHFEWDKRYTSPHTQYGISRAVYSKLQHKYNFESFGVSEYDIERYTTDVIQEGLSNLAHFQGIYGVEEIIDAISVYLHSDIQKCLHSHEFFIVALAILDRRCGKRTLEKYADYDYLIAPDWLKRIFRLRFEAEGIKYSEFYKGGQ